MTLGQAISLGLLYGIGVRAHGEAFKLSYIHKETDDLVEHEMGGPEVAELLLTVAFARPLGNV